MADQWDPLEKPKDGATFVEEARWKFQHIAAFQRAHPEFPQGDWTKLKARDQKLVMNEYDLSVARAKHGGALPPEVEKAIRTGVVTTKRPAKPVK